MDLRGFAITSFPVAYPHAGFQRAIVEAPASGVKDCTPGAVLTVARQLCDNPRPLRYKERDVVSAFDTKPGMNNSHIDLVLYRGFSELRAEAARSYLGIIWWVMEPALFVVVFYLVFEMGFRRGSEDFVPYLLCGLVPWKWFDGTVRSTSAVLSGSVGLMRQLYLPKYLLPLAVVVTNTLKFFIVLAILLVFLWLYGVSVFNPALVYLPLVVVVQLLLIIGVGGLAAALVPLLPDLRYVVNYGLMMLFFMSGIFFSLSDMSPEAQRYLVLNPMLLVIDAYRSILLDASMPDMTRMAAVAAASAVMTVAAAIVFQRFDRVYPRVMG
jgi:lipopolysaccharide transport system permease protein